MNLLSKHVGLHLTNLANVDVLDLPDRARCVTIDLDGQNEKVDPVDLTPEQAKAIGRALIKAAEHIENRAL